MGEEPRKTLRLTLGRPEGQWDVSEEPLSMGDTGIRPTWQDPSSQPGCSPDQWPQTLGGTPACSKAGATALGAWLGCWVEAEVEGDWLQGSH